MINHLKNVFFAALFTALPGVTSAACNIVGILSPGDMVLKMIPTNDGLATGIYSLPVGTTEVSMGSIVYSVGAQKIKACEGANL